MTARCGRRAAGSRGGASRPWRGSWIWDGAYDLRNSYVCFRKAFELPEEPERALVRISADSRYKLWVNGVFVCRGPARGYPHAQPYDELDIASHLRRGRNCIAALAHNYGVSNFQYLHRGGKGFLLDGEAELPSGERVELSTGADWKCLRDGARRRRVARSSIQTGYQEHFDARVEPAGWLLPEFDDSTWKAASIEGPVPTMPWSAMEPRGIPMLREGPLELPAALLHEREGECAPFWREAENVYELTCMEKRLAPGGAHVTAASPSGPYRVEGAPQGRFRAFVLDMGRETAGFPFIEVEGASGGECIDLAFMEYLVGGEFPSQPDPWCKTSMSDRYICRSAPGGTQSHEFFNLRAGRYVLVVVRDCPRPVSVRFGMKAAGYPFEERGAFECSDETLNRIWKLGARTQQLCAFDAHVDCPWREQAQWWGDARVQGLVTFHAFGDLRLLRRGIHQGAQSRTFEGLLWGVFPTDWPYGILPDYSLAWILSLHDYALCTGDTGFVRENLEVVDGILAFYRAKAVHGVAPGKMPGRWVFLDWAPLDREGLSATHTLLWLWATQAASRACSWALARAEAARYAREARRIAADARRVFYDPSARVVRESADLRTLDRSAQVSNHANALAVLTDLVPGSSGDVLANAVLPSLREEKSDAVLASSYFMAYVVEALFKAGMADEAVAAIRRWWGKYLADGATSLYEGWPSEAQAHSSRCHAWSGSPTYLLPQWLLGVRALAPGASRLEVAPRLTAGIAWARGKVPTGAGEIEVSWSREGKKAELRVSLPKGAKADLRLGKKTKAASGGRHVLGAEV